MEIAWSIFLILFRVKMPKNVFCKFPNSVITIGAEIDDLEGKLFCNKFSAPQIESLLVFYSRISRR